MISRLFLGFSFFLSFYTTIVAQELELVKDIASATANSNIIRSLPDNDNLFFVVENPDKSQSLWFHENSTNISTFLLKDSTFTTTSFPFGRLTLWNHKVFFAKGSIWARELWVSDGTLAGTNKIQDNIGSFAQANLANESTGYGQFMPGTNVLYFYCKTSAYGSTELWKTNGTISGTSFLDYTNDGGGMREKDSKSNLFYYAKKETYNVTSKVQVWVANGTTTSFVKTLGTTSNNTYLNILSFPSFTIIEKDSSNFLSLFSANNTFSSITTLQTNIKSSNFYLAYMRFGFYGNNVFFNWCGSPDNQEIWRSDGTISGTVPITNAPISNISFDYNGVEGKYLLFNAYLTAISYIDNFCILDMETSQIRLIQNQYGSSLWPKRHFSNYGDLYMPKGLVGNDFYFLESSGNSLYKVIPNTDIYSVIDPVILPDVYHDLHSINNSLIVEKRKNNTSELDWLIKRGELLYSISDSIQTPKLQNFKFLCKSNSIIYFSAFDIANGNELWKTDGTSIGTKLVKDINNSVGSSNPYKIVPFGSGVSFMADNGLNDYEPWFSNGNIDSTKLMHDIFGIVTPYINASTNIQNKMFSLYGGNHLVKYDKSLYTYVTSSALSIGTSYDTKFVLMGGNYYYTGYSSGSGEELYKLSSNTNSVSLVRDIYNSSSFGSFPNRLTVVGNILFFNASSNNLGRELFKSDGTYSGTVMIKDITAGSGSTKFTSFNALNQKLIFVTDTSKIWISDGTDLGTSLVYDFGNTAKILESFFYYQNKLYFGVKFGSNPGLYCLNSDFSINFLTNINFSNEKDLIIQEFMQKFIISSNNQLLSFDPQSNNQSLILNNIKSTELIPAFNALYFRGCIGSECEIWRMNPNNTVEKIFDINPGSLSSDPSELTLNGNSLFFVATREDVGRELFRITNCPFYKTISSSHTISEKIETAQYIQSTAVIPFGKNIIYDSGQTIILSPGFLSENGSTFKAIIDGCGNQ